MAREFQDIGEPLFARIKFTNHCLEFLLFSFHPILFFLFLPFFFFRLFSLSMILAPLERFVRPSSSPKTINFLSRSKHISRYYANTREIVIILFDEETDSMESSLTFPDFPYTVISYAKRNRKRGTIFFFYYRRGFEGGRFFEFSGFFKIYEFLSFPRYLLYVIFDIKLREK